MYNNTVHYKVAAVHKHTHTQEHTSISTQHYLILSWKIWWKADPQWHIQF